MKTALLKLCVFAGCLALAYSAGRSSPPPTLVTDLAVTSAAAPTKDATTPILPTGLTDEFGQICYRLGLHNSDTVLEVNGVKNADPTAISAGYRTGNLCVLFRRGGNLRKTCFTRDENVEKIVNAPA